MLLYNYIYFLGVFCYFSSETRIGDKKLSMDLYAKRVFPRTISYHLYFLCISEVWSMLYQSVGRAQSKECYFMFTFIFGIYLFLAVFHRKISVFIIFMSFSDELSNFRNRILTNQNSELVIKNRQ